MSERQKIARGTGVVFAGMVVSMFSLPKRKTYEQYPPNQFGGIEVGRRVERGISFFDQRPRKDKSRLFGRSEELNRLVNALHAKSWVAILGPRMAGKTSLALAGANSFAEEMKYRVIFVDLRNTETSRQATEKILGRLPKSILETLTKYIAEVSLSAGGTGGGVRLRENAAAKNALEDALFFIEEHNTNTR